MRVLSTIAPFEEGRRGTQNTRSRPPAPPSVLGPGNFTLSGRRKKSAKTWSRAVRRSHAPRQAFTTTTLTPRPVTRLAIQHATQRQAARYAAKTPLRMFMLHMELFV